MYSSDKNKYCGVKATLDGEYWLRRYTNRSSSMSNATRAIIEYFLQNEVDLIYEITRMIDELPGFIGLCFPSACSRRDVSKFFNFMTPVLRAFLAISVNFTVGSCETREDINNRPIPDTAIMFLCFVVLLCCFCIFGTISDYMSTKNNSMMSVVRCFSVRANYASLWREEACPLRRMLHGLRGMAVVWFITGNFVYLHSVMLTRNMLLLKDMIKDLVITFVLNFSLAEDTIIFVAAVFFAFELEQKGASIRGVVCCCLYIVLHMLSLIAFCMGFVLLLLPHLGQGPSWSFEMSRFTTGCAEHWWKNLLMINNFVSRKQQCIEQLWLPSFLVQCSFVGAALVYFLITRPVFGRLLTLVTILSSALVTVTITLTFDSGPTLLLREYKAGTRHVYFDEVYTKIYTRGGVFFVGVYLGLFLSKYKSLNVSKCDNAIGWLLTVAVSMALIYSTYYWNRGLKLPTSMEAAIFAGLHRLVWCGPLLFMCLSCAVGYARLILWMLSWRIWAIFSRLTYCMLLSHAYVILYSNGIARSPFFFSYDYLSYLVLHHVVFAILVSIILSLLVEKPVTELLKLCGLRPFEAQRVSQASEPPQPKPTLQPILIVAQKPKRRSNDTVNNRETCFELR
ncbi:O-acyltransferase like protein-like [Varroa destructor]|uniref:Nose resistant to fluoxetine protein 6 n=1 Tax=Varroa destructor TaxID=109461 RepID=A0A7M7JML9_VARDE|nr:O-acyltransferase like protein-like [Varroa destructor]